MKIAIEHLLGIRYKLQMMCMEVETCFTLFGDKNAVITNTQLPSSTLNKEHNLAAFRKSHEAVAAECVKTGHIDSNKNDCDILKESIGPIDFYYLTGSILYSWFPKYYDTS